MFLKKSSYIKKKRLIWLHISFLDIIFLTFNFCTFFFFFSEISCSPLKKLFFRYKTHLSLFFHFVQKFFWISYSIGQKIKSGIFILNFSILIVDSFLYYSYYLKKINFGLLRFVFLSTVFCMNHLKTYQQSILCRFEFWFFLLIFSITSVIWLLVKVLSNNFFREKLFFFSLKHFTASTHDGVAEGLSVCF